MSYKKFWVSVGIGQKLLIYAVCLGMLLKYSIGSIQDYMGKPTAATIEMKEIDGIEFPDLQVCTVPGYDAEVFRQYGYESILDYYVGGRNSVGWNGANVTAPASDIIKEALHAHDVNDLISSMYVVYVKESSTFG